MQDDFSAIIVIIFSMKKLLAILFLFCFTLSVNAEVLEAGVSVEEVPKALFGIWRVNAKLDSTNSYKTFKAQSIDFWNLIRSDGRITLENPYSGANAEVSVTAVEGNLVVFTKKTPYDNNKILTDTVNIRIDGDKFSGINILKLESFSLIDNHLLKTETAQYLIKGEKISGESIISE